MRNVKLTTISTFFTAFAFSAQAEINVVTSIKPIHSLVANVMEGVSKPSLIVKGAASPHNYSLKPSQARELENADVVFWFGESLEAFLEKPIETIAKNAKKVELMEAHDLIKMPFREGGGFDEHDHGHDEHKDHDDHGDKEHKDHDDHGDKEHKDHDDHGDKEHKDHDDHGHKEHKDHDDHGHKEHKDHDDHGDKEHKDHDDHGHGEYDPHVWLDPINAKSLVHEIEEVLMEVDPKNASVYKANAKRVSLKLDELTKELQSELSPYHDKGFIVFHDAYQYFEKRFDVTAVGSITVSPEIIPGVQRISEIQDKILDSKASCVFSEPQFEPKLVNTVIQNTKARTGVLDPLGATIKDGPELYFQLIRNMAKSLKDCLSGS